MERRPFGSTKREVAGHRAGDLVPGGRRPRRRDRRAAPGPRPRHDPHRHGGDVRTGRRGDRRRGDRRAPRRGVPGLQGPARATPRGSGTVAACERSLARLRHRPAGLLPPALARRAPAGGHDRRLRAAPARGQDPLLGREQLRRGRPRRGAGRSPARAASPATRCSTICRSARSSTPCSRGARRTASPWSPTARSATGDFPGPRTAGGRVLQEIAAAHGATPRQVALRFLVRRPSLFAIPKASSPEHAAENAGAGDLQLTSAELARIDEAFPLGPRPRTLPTL